MAWHPFRNLGLKLLALLLGTLLWFAVSGHQIERRISVPVTYRNVPANLELVGEQTDRVVVHVRGDDRVVSELTEGALRVTVDLAGAREGGNIVTLRTDQVGAPGRVEVLQVEPGTVTVTLERVGQIRVPVTANVDGQPPPGQVVSSVATDPPTVIVAGPENRLTGTIRAITERVAIEGRSGRIVEEVGVGVEDARLRIISPRTVRVIVQIDPAPAGSDETGEPADDDGAAPRGEQ